MTRLVVMAYDPPKKLRPGDLIREASAIRANIATNPGDLLTRMDLAKATELESRARERLPRSLVQKGVGNELIPIIEEFALKNTVANPDYIAASASRQRLDLAVTAGALETGLDMAETIGAKNSAENMLAHQLAASHAATMKMMAQVNCRIERLGNSDSLDSRSAQKMATINIEACRLSNAVARMMTTFQQGLLTLQRLRTGGTQTVNVVHQQVSPTSALLMTILTRRRDRSRLHR
jgi:hypothetical protein